MANDLHVSERLAGAHVGHLPPVTSGNVLPLFITDQVAAGGGVTGWRLVGERRMPPVMVVFVLPVANDDARVGQRAAAREARRARGQSIGRPRALDKSKSALAQRMHANGESASTIANTLGVSRATVYRVLAQSTE
jgi:hypothetical protein